MKKANYQRPLLEKVVVVQVEDLLVTVSGKSGSLSDGTEIGDGGSDDGEVIPYAKRSGGFWDD